MRARTDFWQSPVDDAPLSLRASTERLARDIIKPHLGEALAEGLKLGDVKILMTLPGTGEQDVHCDVPNWSEAEKVYTVLFYLNGPVPGTHLPNKPYDAEVSNSVCFQADAKGAREILSKEREFHQNTCNQGDWLLLQTSVPHFGPLNTTSSPRWVLFMQFLPENLVIDSDEQRYPHGIQVPDEVEMQ